MTLGQLIAQVRAEFDASQADVEAWANERHRRMVGESLWRAVEKPVGTTVAEQAAYPVEADMLDLSALAVDGVEYGRVSPQQMWQAVSGRGTLAGDGVYSGSHDSDGTAQIKLWPVPVESGLSIDALMAYEPADLGTNDTPIFPVHLHSAWRDGVFADAYEILDGRHDLAALHEQRFETGIAKLARLRVSRIGGGAQRARVAGRDF